MAKHIFMTSSNIQLTTTQGCSILQTNLVIQIEAWLKKSIFPFQFEKFEQRMDSNFEQQNQILILGQNTWPGLTVNTS